MTSIRLLGTSLPGDGAGQFSAQYTHDAHGNMTAMPHLSSIGWDFKDQKREVDLGGGGTVYFTYDVAGQRVRKVWEHSGIIEERIYLGAFEIYRRTENSSVVLERETLHVMDDTRRIAMAETKTVDTSDPNLVVTPRIRYQLGNHLGSAMLELDETGLVISYEEYHPYGTTAYHAVASGVEVSAKRYRYTGKEKDEETGLYYHGARYYAPWLGRWTSVDPMGLPHTSAYVYGDSNPITKNDPTGLQAASGADDIVYQGNVTIDGVEYRQYSTFAGDFVWQEPVILEAPTPSSPEVSKPEGRPASATPEQSEKKEVEIEPKEQLEEFEVETEEGEEHSGLVRGMLGFAYGVGQAWFPGGVFIPSASPNDRTFEFWRGAGQFTAGAVELFSGFGLIGGGGAAAGGGLIAAVPTGGAGLVLTAGGAATVTVGLAAVAQGSAGILAGIKTMADSISLSTRSGSSDDGYRGERRSTKGKTFRGGGKRTRDNWHGFDREKDFVKWWHRQGKEEFGGNDIDNAAQAREIYEYWVNIGRPVPK
jgi:RHS repeat-associated protein